MLIILVVILAWTIIGGTVSLWLAAADWRCSTREALAAGLACGPAVWLFIATCFAADYIRRS